MSDPTSGGSAGGASAGDASDRGAWLVPLLLLVGTGALLGVSTNLAKLAGEAGLDPLAFLAWSVAGAAAVLLVVQGVRGRLPPVNARTGEYFVVSGLLSVVVSNLVFFAAVPRIGAGFVSLAVSLPPLFTYLGALALGMERLQARRALGVALALGGAAVLAVYKLAGPGADPAWVGATLGATVLLAAGNLYRTARWPEGATPDELAPGMLAASAVMLVGLGGVLALVPGTPGGFSLVVPVTVEAAVASPSRLGAVPPLGLVLAQVAVFSVQNLLFFALQKKGGPVYLSLLGSVGALVGVPVAVLVLGEEWPQGIIAGGVLIALGVAALTLGGAKVDDSPDE